LRGRFRIGDVLGDHAHAPGLRAQPDAAIAIDLRKSLEPPSPLADRGLQQAHAAL